MTTRSETVLFTFIGRTQKEKVHDTYQRTCYEIDGTTYPEATLIGFTLCTALSPQRVVIFGTSGSRWDQLFDTDLDLGNRELDARLALSDAADNHAVTQQHLQQLQPLLKAHLGIDVHLQLVPVGLGTKEQVALVQCMAGQIERGDKVHLDVTHGLRSTPMLGLLVALYLREVLEVGIDGIWYGAHDLARDGVTPVINLRGLLEIASWISAMNSYKKDGDYSVFAPLLDDNAHLLEEAAFYERINNTGGAKEKLGSWAGSAINKNDPIAILFAPELERRLNWYQKSTRHEREQQLAQEYLQRGDYLRASTLGLEGLISAEAFVQKLGDGVADRERASKSLRENSEDYNTFTAIRNAMAHGLRSEDKFARKFLRSRERLESELKRLFKSLQIGR